MSVIVIMSDKRFKLNIFLKSDEKVGFYENINSINISKLKYIIPVAIILDIIHITIFIFNREPLISGTELIWHNGIIYSHLTLIFIFILSGFFVLMFLRKKNISPLVIKIFSNFLFITVIFIGVVITIYDQYVTTSISPYILVTIFIPLVAIINPFNAAIYYFLSFALFHILLPYTQPDENVFSSNIVNALSTVFFGSFLSFTVWSNNLKNFRQNITIQKQQHELSQQNYKLQVMADELRHTNNSKDKFFSIIAHDLKSPLSGFIGMTKMLSDNIENLTLDEIRKSINEVNDTSTNLYKLLENLLEWSRVQRGLIKYNPEQFLIYFLFEENSKLLNKFAMNKNIEISNNIPSDIFVYADVTMLNTIIRNLVTNAIKFTNKGGNIRFDYQDTADHHIFIITDTGIGMNEQIAANLFSPEFKSSRAGTNNEPSTGLGLILCKEFINLNNGNLWVESRENIGSKFHFSIPKQIN